MKMREFVIEWLKVVGLAFASLFVFIGIGWAILTTIGLI